MTKIEERIIVIVREFGRKIVMDSFDCVRVVVSHKQWSKGVTRIMMIAGQ